MITKLVIRNYFRKPLNIQERYGKGTWAMVTGATGGIGEAYCLEFAKQNFNIVLSGRSLEKLQDMEEKVKKINGKVKTKIVTADLGETVDVDFYKKIYEQVKDLDISILVNNAAWGEVAPFDEKSLDFHLGNARTNAGAPTMITHSLIDKLTSRNKKSAIINVSAAGQNAPVPYAGVYPATKRYLTIFSYFLHDNFGDKIDVQNLTPGYVSTKIVGHRKGGDTISPEVCIKSSLRDLGQEFNCLPVIAHSIYAQVFHTLYRYCKPLYKVVVVDEVEMTHLRKFYNTHKEPLSH
mmetsp:Transcript_4937/g.4719  ORF Transcript_4937/g.4719 Transcript_4937/m.4719 type:complete len:293 (+) Transcript_4937:100-978(+)|eukprot:CAMPEP_0197005898 /NCGR_PEP_ID=MMETSP1380-20130617/31922_1 /TAXON_ID=5936 /ORGANISM="Euplotes crassus, Strain CT5" /LENGTH=292 /DNA_ID=CAMNT_0042425223 /DNA_START=88 /DNA_END=966 /DNA_ORIENTATION=-